MIIDVDTPIQMLALLENEGSRVNRSVIDNDELKIAKSLAQNAIDRFPQVEDGVAR